MKNNLVDSVISSINNNNNKNKENICAICKCEKLPIDITKKSKYEMKILSSKFKIKETDFPVLIKKCNCTKQSPKVHKLCIILNLLYNFNLKCSECNADYNISIRQIKNTSKKLCNICSLIFYLFINLIIYAAAAFLIAYPLLVNKNSDNDPEWNKAQHIYYFFGGLIFLLNTFFIYITISVILFNNPDDVNDYSVDIKDISEPNKNKNSDKYYNLLYKFYRYFYNSQIRFLIGKKHKNIYIAKGYGYFNKDLQNLIIKNNKEWEKENRLFNGGEDILNINKNNSKNNKNGLNILPDNNHNEQSNGNIENDNVENIKRSSTLKVKNNKKEDKEVNKKESKNNTSYLPNVSNDKMFTKNNENNEIRNSRIHNKDHSDKRISQLKENNNDQNGSTINEKEQKTSKKLLIEVINTDKKIESKENDKKSQKEEIKSKHDSENNNANISHQSEKDKIVNKILNKSKISKKSSDSKKELIKKEEKKAKEESKNESIYSPRIQENDNDKVFIEASEINNGDKDKVEKDKVDKDKGDDDNDKIEKKEIIEEPFAFLDNFNGFVSSPFHNNGK